VSSNWKEPVVTSFKLLPQT